MDERGQWKMEGKGLPRVSLKVEKSSTRPEVASIIPLP